MLKSISSRFYSEAIRKSHVNSLGPKRIDYIQYYLCPMPRTTCTITSGCMSRRGSWWEDLIHADPLYKSILIQGMTQQPLPQDKTGAKRNRGAGYQSRSNLRRIFRKSIEKNSEKLGNWEVPNNIWENFIFSCREHLGIVEISPCWILPPALCTFLK